MRKEKMIGKVETTPLVAKDSGSRERGEPHEWRLKREVRTQFLPR
jgi:hypothetical protein